VGIVKFSHKIFNRHFSSNNILSLNNLWIFQVSLHILHICFFLTFSLEWAHDRSIHVSEAGTLVLSREGMRSKAEDWPKLQHLSCSERGLHQLESAFESENQTVKKFILNSLDMKVSVVCLVIILLQEFN
jgi:hypothetical protein